MSNALLINALLINALLICALLISAQLINKLLVSALLISALLISTHHISALKADLLKKKSLFKIISVHCEIRKGKIGPTCLELTRFVRKNWKGFLPSVDCIVIGKGHSTALPLHKR